MMKMMMMMLMVMMMMVTSEANMIEEVCNITSYYDLCVSIVKSDPRGATANATGIALIVVDKVKDVVTMGVKQINDLYKTKPELKQALDVCSQVYNGINKTEIPETVYGLTRGVSFLADDGMAVAGIEANFCEQQFRGKSPLTNLTSSLQLPAIIIRTIVRKLLFKKLKI